MTLFHSPSVQAPAAYSNLNLQGNQLAARMAAAANAAQRASLRTAIQDSGYRYKIHPAETAAGYTDADLTFGFDFGNFRRYGAVVNGAADDAAALRKAFDCVPLEGGRVFCDPPGNILVGSVVYIPQRVAGSFGTGNGVGIDIDLSGCTLLGTGPKTGQIFESGTGIKSTGGASNFLQPPESATAVHNGTHIHGGTFKNYAIAIKIFNWLQGCKISNVFSWSGGQTLIYHQRSFYMHYDNVHADMNGLLATDVLFDLYDTINTVLFNNVHMAGGVSATGIGYRFNSSVLGTTLTGFGAESLTTGYTFLGEILGVNFSGNYIENCTTALNLASICDGFNVEANYFNSNTTAVVATNWTGGRWGHNHYDGAGNAVNLSAAGNLCEVWIPPRQYYRQGSGAQAHNLRTFLPTGWTVNAGCTLRLTDYIYNDAAGFSSAIGWLSQRVGGDGQVSKNYTGKINPLHSGQIPFCTTTVAGTSITVDTQIPFDADAGGIEFDICANDNTARRYICGRTLGGTSVFRYDATAMTVTVSNNAGFFRFVFANFNVAVTLNGGEIRLL